MLRLRRIPRGDRRKRPVLQALRKAGEADMNERTSNDFIIERMRRAKGAIDRIDKLRYEELNQKIVLRSDTDYLLYSIANSLLALVEIANKMREERQ